MIYFFYLIIIFTIILLIIDILTIYSPKSKLEIFPINYEINSDIIKFSFKIINKSSNKETMVPDLDIELDFLDNENLINIDHSKKIIIDDYKSKNSITNYWKTIIVKSNSFVKVDLIINSKVKHLEDKNIWLKLNWTNYGHFGFLKKQNCFLLNKNISINDVRKLIEIPNDNNYKIIAIKTNIFGIFNNPINTISYYCKDIVRKGDILVIGETPLAIMQGRYINPLNITYSPFSKLLCYFFHPTSSLATACGMQLLINRIGITRIIYALLIGLIFKFFGINGIFYRLTGKESSLIDDISGTTFPYDKSIVLGPINSKEFCDHISSLLDIDVAVADVNDLGKTKIIYTSNKSITNILKKNLRHNPAGNDDQITPIVLIRKNII